MLRAYNDVSFRHTVDVRIKGYLFWLDDCADGVTEIDLGYLEFVFGKYCAEFALAFYLCQLFYVFHVFLVWFRVPEHYTELNSIRFLECKD